MINRISLTRLLVQTWNAPYTWVDYQAKPPKKLSEVLK